MRERKARSEQPPDQPFHFTEHEKLFDRLTHQRLMQLAADPSSTLHRAHIDTNSYGEFFFATISRPNEKKERDVYTFFGLGLHEQRDRYYVDEWHFYISSFFRDEKGMPFDEFAYLVQQRLDEITPEYKRHRQSARGRLFEEIADLTDDDGAIADIEDFPELFDD